MPSGLLVMLQYLIRIISHFTKETDCKVTNLSMGVAFRQFNATENTVRTTGSFRMLIASQVFWKEELSTEIKKCLLALIYGI